MKLELPDRQITNNRAVIEDLGAISKLSPEELYKVIKELSTQTISDKEWLLQIIDHAPHPIGAYEAILWRRLGKKVSEADGLVELSAVEAEMLYDRISTTKFEHVPAPFGDFLIDFQEWIGKEFSLVEDKEE